MKFGFPPVVRPDRGADGSGGGRGRPGIGHDPASGQLDDPADEPVGALDIVGHQHEGQAQLAAQADQHVDQPRAGPLVQAGERLVQHEQPRPAGQQPGQRDPPLLAAAQLVHPAVTDLTGVQPDQGQRFVGRGRVHRAGVLHVAPHRRPQQLEAGMLEGHRHPAHLLTDRTAVQQREAFARTAEAGQDPGQRRLPGPVPAHDQHALARPDGEIDILEGPLGPRRTGRIDMADAPQLQERRPPDRLDR